VREKRKMATHAENRPEGPKPSRPLIETRDLYKWFPIKGGLLGRTVANVRAVDGVTLAVNRGETLGLVGESGSGKTTVARVIMRLTPATRGEVLLDGTDITRVQGQSLRRYRREMQMVFQDPYASLDPRQTVGSALTETMRINRVVDNKKAGDEAAARLVEIVGLNPDHLARFPHEFSGGQRQRIAVARALAVNPEFLLLDEPTSSLDVSVQAQILNLLKRLQNEFKLTYMFISHNLSVIKHMSDRVAVMYLGRVVEVASTDVLFANPKHPYTLALLSAIPDPDPSRRGESKVIIQGDVPSPIDIPSGCRFRGRCPYATQKCASDFPPLTEIEPLHWVECHYDLVFGREKLAPGNTPADSN
jgi:oligopeptide/dipeptide ABC transporter ATP-binding protein